MKLIAANFTKHPEIGLSSQIRDFLRKHGSSSGVEVRKGIARDRDAGRCIAIDVNTTLNRMAKGGQLVREKMKGRSYYSIDIRRASKPKASIKMGPEMARKAYKRIRKVANLFPYDLREDIISEAYLRIASGVYDGDLEELMLQAKRHVIKEYRGGWREDYTIDGALTDTGFNLLDVLSDDDVESHTKLFHLEKRVDKIMLLLSHGYEDDQIEHLWFTGGTTWLNQAIC